MDSDQPETPLIQRQIKLELKSDGLVYCKMCIPITGADEAGADEAGADEAGAGSPKFLGTRLQKNSKFTAYFKSKSTPEEPAEIYEKLIDCQNEECISCSLIEDSD